MPTSAIIYDAYTSIITKKKKKLKNLKKKKKKKRSSFKQPLSRLPSFQKSQDDSDHS